MTQHYSDWFRIDLHIHTDSSKTTKEDDYCGKFSISQLKQKLIDNEVKIFSLTDHNIININAYSEYYSTYDNDNDPLLLTGVELDIQGSNKKYHSLLIFNHCDLDSTKIISDKLEKKYSEKNISDPKQRVLTFDDIISIFRDEDFFFIPHAGNADKNIVSGNRNSIPDTEKMLILMQSALEKVTDEEIKKHYEIGFDKILNTSFRSKKDIAYINFSDNHCCENYPVFHKGEKQHSFYYIKGSKSYESIRLAFIDPVSRIKLQEEYDKLSSVNNRLEKLSISNDIKIKSTEINFSPCFNAIIGGRSSGKSLLLWLLGKSINGVSNLTENKYPISDESVKIKSINDASYVNKTILDSDCVYIQQGEITNYFEENKLSELAAKTGKMDMYNRLKQNLQKKSDLLSKKSNKVIEIYRETFNHFANQELFRINRIDINNSLSSDFIVKNLSIENNMDDYITGKNLLSQTIVNLNQILEFKYLKFTEAENEQVKKIIDLLTLKEQSVKKLIQINERKNKFITDVNSIISEVNNTLDSGAKNKVQSNSNIENVKKLISERFIKLRLLKLLTDEISTFDYSGIEEISFSNEIQLKIEIKKTEDISYFLKDGFSKRDQDESLYLILLRVLLKEKDYYIKNFKNNSPESFEKKIKNQLEEVYDLIRNPIDYLSYENGETSDGKSPGYNSEQYLKIVLNSPNNKTIFIDQPEDNLGNSFISNELVKIIRDIKEKKQLFFVTHNPSIVVYGDAENIILAENNNGIISYKQLVLEDKDAQEIICNTLDGGQYIFYNRFNKYNIHRLQLKEKNDE